MRNKQKNLVVKNYLDSPKKLSRTSRILIVDDEACNCEVLK